MPFAYKTLGRNIRNVRKEKKITQEQAAELLGMSVLHYGRLERGERNISLDHLMRIAALFQVSVYVLLEGCFLEDLPYSPADARPQPNPLLTQIEKLSARDQKIILELCLALARM